MRRSLALTAALSLTVLLGVLLSSAPAQSQTGTCPPGQARNGPYCETVPPLPAACGKFTSKLELLRATFDRLGRTLSILVPISSRASGAASIQLRAAGVTKKTSGPIAKSRIRVTRSITAAQARLATGILTIDYPGDADTRRQSVRLRAANNPAQLDATRPTITAAGVLMAKGSISKNAAGVVRVQIEFVDRLNGQTVTLQYTAKISGGTWGLNVQLPPAVLAAIARRCGSLHSYTLYTGYIPRRMRGEMESFQVLPAQ